MELGTISRRASENSVVNIEDVKTAYRLLLGREPEDEAVLLAHTQHSRSFEELRAAFFRSTEFQNLAAQQTAFRPLLRPLDWPPIRVELDASSAQLASMMRNTEATWNQLGVSEPHWSVLAHDAFLATNIAKVEPEFYESGKDAIHMLCRTAERCGTSLSGLSRCFELGCGLGRITIWLAGLFERLVAADISPAHLALARQAVDRLEVANVELVHLHSFGTFEAIPEFDVFFSFIVLQHNPPPLIAALLRIILGKLRAGGIAYFQVPTYRLNYDFQIEEYLRSVDFSGRMEMHVIPQSVLFDILRQSGCRVLECREDNWTGDPGIISNTIFAKKENPFP
jgi:SAM-dependent methyltransferase